MKLLIIYKSNRIIHMNTFGKELSKAGIKCEIVHDTYIADRSLRRIHKWKQSMKQFYKIVDDFKPDAILGDPGHFGVAAIKSNIPMIIHLRGDIWRETELEKNIRHKSFPKNLIHKRWESILQTSLEGSKIIMPVSKYLGDIVQKKLPDKPIHILYPGIDSSMWRHEKGMELRHPCVGLIQNAEIWKKTKEMLILTKVLEKLPKITFYWAGNGRYAQNILQELKKYPNFKWLGQLDYPNEIRRFLSEIDVFALVTGMDALSRSLEEALLMEKPAIATNVGGIPEIMENGKSGFLVEQGDYEMIIEKILYMLENEKNARRMGQYGRTFVEKKFSWNNIVKEFVKNIE